MCSMRLRVFFAFLLSFYFLVFPQSEVLGIWENGGRFIEFEQKGDALNMRIVLKPYYRFVYDEQGNFVAGISDISNFEGLNILQIQYPKMKNSVYMPICIMDDFLFTSFFQRNDFSSSEPKLPPEATPYGITAEQAKDAMFIHESPLYGFWTEQGTKEGIMLHANEAPEYFDAYFFTDDEYFRFRYWKDDLANIEKTAHFTDSKGVTFYVPRVLSRGNLNYSCITANASVLRNYEVGNYNLEVVKDTYYITLTSIKAGPGSNAAKATYEQYPKVINLPLYITKDGKIFSYGEPFLFRSLVSDLDAEILKHNSKKKPPLEPQLIPDQIDFYEQKIKELQKLIPQNNETLN